MQIDVRKIRKKCGLKQDEFAIILGISKPTYIKYENGDKDAMQIKGQLIQVIEDHNLDTTEFFGENLNISDLRNTLAELNVIKYTLNKAIDQIEGYLP